MFYVSNYGLTALMHMYVLDRNFLLTLAAVTI
jgi:hypothetical protein